MYSPIGMQLKQHYNHTDILVLFQVLLVGHVAQVEIKGCGMAPPMAVTALICS